LNEDEDFFNGKEIEQLEEEATEPKRKAKKRERRQ